MSFLTRLNLVRGIPCQDHCTFHRTLAKDSVAPINDIETHTGQKFDKDDYRLARFVDKEKQVNTEFAINLIEEVPPKACKERVVWCDGGSGPEGHPRVYINLDKPGNHSCNYCGLRFYKKDSHHH
ncbi:hypothetical protein WDU94_008514 [Cyamophila willieti]